MSKELVISASRHETRVAVLEDDQLVEIYVQRENEYSLAGSIHKGRVTRVLPGMQSAFVNIGLDRDAFLYVSDFFEDNEEYDKIVTSVEEKVLKLDKTPLPPAEPVEPEAPEPAAEPAVPVVAAAPADTGPALPHPPQQDDRDRRGRRRRRRQRSGGRGLPDSKFYTPSGEQPEPEEVAVSEDEDLAVLPGESLAKYSRADDIQPDADAGVESDWHSGISPEPPDVEAEPVADTSAETEAPEMRTATPEHTGQSDDPEEFQRKEDSGASLNEAAAGPEAPSSSGTERVRDDDRRSVHSGPEASSFSVTEPAGYSELDVAPEDTAFAVDESGIAVAAENGEETGAGASADLDGGESDAQAGASESAEREVEPARIPTSLTATLREQGGRYGHRVSRRMRRRGRQGEERQPERPERPDRTERPERPERGDRTERAASTEPRPAERQDRQGRAERPAQPSISDLLREGQEIIVQIAKEPLGQKGARITSHIALPGRFLVYMPTVDHIGVSRKIGSDEERMRLKRILQSNRTGIPGGYIVRTAGQGHTEEELRADMLFLYNLWLDMRQKAEKRPAPVLIHHDLSVVQRILRDQLTSDFKTIWVDHEEIYENVLGFVQRFQPVLVGRVKMYTRVTPIFEQFGITPELEKALRPKVWLKSGGYIVINQTEALVAIDINTGKFVGKSNRLEDTIVKTNTDAIHEIVRQIRLRDLGGIIVVDFIDMEERKNRQKVMQTLEEAMRADRAPYKILSFNDFGLVAITRKRVKQSLERTMCSPCPYCEGAGYVKSVQTVIGEILIEAQKIARAVEPGDVMLRVNPEVAKILKSNQNAYLQEIEETLKRNVIVKSDPQLHQERFDLA
jgi:ribonuclease G